MVVAAVRPGLLLRLPSKRMVVLMSGRTEAFTGRYVDAKGLALPAGNGFRNEVSLHVEFIKRWCEVV